MLRQIINNIPIHGSHMFFILSFSSRFLPMVARPVSDLWLPDPLVLDIGPNSHCAGPNQSHRSDLRPPLVVSLTHPWSQSSRAVHVPTWPSIPWQGVIDSSEASRRGRADREMVQQRAGMADGWSNDAGDPRRRWLDDDREERHRKEKHVVGYGPQKRESWSNKIASSPPTWQVYKDERWYWKVVGDAHGQHIKSLKIRKYFMNIYEKEERKFRL